MGKGKGTNIWTIVGGMQMVGVRRNTELGRGAGLEEVLYNSGNEGYYRKKRTLCCSLLNSSNIRSLC